MCSLAPSGSLAWPRERMEEGDPHAFNFAMDLNAPSHRILRASGGAGRELWDAAKNGSLSIVSRLLRVNANLEYENVGRTPLTVACEYGHEDVVKLLLASGASRDTTDVHVCPRVSDTTNMIWPKHSLPCSPPVTKILTTACSRLPGRPADVQPDATSDCCVQGP